MKRCGLLVFAILAVALLLSTLAVAALGPCDEAKALLDAKLYDKAEGAYIGLLKNDTSYNCSKSELLDLQKERARYFYEIGFAYENAGQVEEARKAYVKALEVDPNFTAAEESLIRMNRNEVDKIKNFLSFIYSILSLFIELIALISIIILASIAIRYKIYPWIKSIPRRRLDIRDFDKGATNLDIGKGLTTIVESNINNFGEIEKRPNINIVTGPPKSLDIPVEIQTTQPLKYVSELLEWAFPENIVELSGTLLSRKSFGAGIALTLANTRTCEIIANEIIWERDFNPEKTISDGTDANQYYRLASIAAIWAIFHFENDKKNDECKPMGTIAAIWAIFHFKKDKKNDEFKPLGTTDWKSFAYYRSGFIWEKEEMWDKARNQYAMALNRDLRNRGALFNLSRLDIQDGLPDLAIERLLKVKQYSEQEEHYVKDTNIHKDPTWYKTMYQLAAAYQYMTGWENAEKNAKELLEAIKNTQQNLNKDECDLRDFLAAIEMEVKIMYAGALIGCNKIDEYESLIEECETYVNDPKYSELSPMQNIFQAYYNLACTYSIAGLKAEKDEKKRVAYKNALSYLKKSLEIGGYNLKWFEKDPSLAGVREDDNIEIDKNETAKKAFKKIIEKYAPKETLDSSDLLPLSGITIIGKTFALKLKTKGIVTHCDMISKAGSDSARIKLSEDLYISPQLLKMWALLSDMTRIEGITPYLNLLNEADIDSLEDLEKSDACELAALLKQLNEAQSIVKEPPSVDIIRGWLKDIRELKPKYRVS